MKPAHTLTAVGILCAASIAWQLHWSSSGSPGAGQQPAAAPTAAEIRITPAPTPATPGTAAAPTAPMARPAEPPTGSSPSPDSALAVAQPVTEDVLGLRVRRDRNCSVTVHHVVDAETGEPRTVYSCTPLEATAADPYEAWDEEVLAGLAYGDAHAAETLGLRNVLAGDPRREALGLALLYRAVALSGEPDALKRATAARYGYVNVNGEPQIHILKQLLVFNRIAEALGDPEARPAEILRALEDRVPAHQVQALEAGAQSILESMAAIQFETTGEQSIREAPDNA